MAMAFSNLSLGTYQKTQFLRISCRKKEREKEQNSFDTYKVIEISPPPKNLGIRCFPPLVLEVKEKLEREHFTLPVGKNGRDDEDMILWFLQDRKFIVDEAVAKMTKAIKWRHEFGVHNLSEDAIKSMALTGKAYVHEFFDISNRPVLIVEASKHFPAVHDRVENERLCVFLIEKALRNLPPGQEEILGVFDLRGFGPENADLKFLTFIFEVFYYYYPKRLGQVLFVEAPFVFKPIWQLAKPLLKSYASLVRFCSVETVRKEYFTETTEPASFRD